MANHQDLPAVVNGFYLMDTEDENQIMREIQGEIIKDFVYSFKGSDGRQVTGLSKVGIDNVCREAAKQGEFFRIIGDPILSDEGEYLRIVVKVGRFICRDGQEIEMDSTLGTKRQWKKMKLRNGNIVPDPFYFEKGMSKAERNGKRKLLPESLIIKMVEQYRKQGRVKEVKAEVITSEPNPSFLDHLAKAKAMLGEKKYEDIIRPWGDPGKIPPELQEEVLNALRVAFKETKRQAEAEEGKPTKGERERKDEE